MSQNNPPFAIGQKVVSLDNGRRIKKGDIVTVAALSWKDCCKYWAVGILEFPANHNNYTCCCCGENSTNSLPYYGGHQKRFAPIQSNYSDATAEILEKFKSPNECPDKVVVPEKVTNHL